MDAVQQHDELHSALAPAQRAPREPALRSPCNVDLLALAAGFFQTQLLLHSSLPPDDPSSAITICSGSVHGSARRPRDGSLDPPQPTVAASGRNTDGSSGLAPPDAEGLHLHIAD